MKEDVYRFAGAVFLTILALLGIGAVLHILVTLPFDGKGPEWVGAIGTVATLIGTIWLATIETRRRRAEAHDLATLAASSIVLRAIRLNSAIRNSIEALTHEQADAGNSAVYRYCLDTISSTERWTIDELVPLVPLPNRAAAKLAFANQMLVTIEIALKRAHSRPLRLGTQPDADLIKQLGHTRDMLASAIVECKKFANQLEPSANE